MKYFIDTEFIEGFHKPLFGKRRHFIDLVSIGIKAEDGREYYAISSEYEFKKADPWVRENVILPMWKETVTGSMRHMTDVSSFHRWYGKTNREIRQDIINFICPMHVAEEYAGIGSLDEGLYNFLLVNPIEFWAYYADYDWIVFCSLFGRMIDLPKGFPMYCRDLKQTFDGCIAPGEIRANGYESAVQRLKSHVDYPLQKTEHNALADARWNLELYKFLKRFKQIAQT